MSARDKLSQQEQWLAYLIGAGITLIIVGFVLNGLGTIDDSNITTSLILIGLALLVIGAGAWLILLRPWTQFDDLTTPHYTGHHAADHAEDHAEDHAAEPEAVAETVAAVVEPAPEPVVAAVAAVAEAQAAGEVEADAPAPTPEPEPVPGAAAKGEVAAESPAETPTEARDDLTLIEGLGPKTQDALYAAGITSFEQVAAMTPDQLVETAKAHGARVSKADTWPEQARKAAGGDITELEDMKARVVAGTLREKLTTIEGLGPKTQEALYAIGITSFQQIADSTPEALRKILDDAGLKLVVSETWPEQAALIVKGDLSALEALQGQLKGGRRVT